MNSTTCCQCDARGDMVELFGYYFCGPCESKLGLHSDKTILKNVASCKLPEPLTYEDEVTGRLDAMESNFIKGKVKLLHILERLNVLP